MALLSIDEIIALEKGATPTFGALNSMAQHVKDNQDDVAALQVGSTPGWAAAVDTRWFLSATGTDTYAATPAGSPGSGDSLSDGMSWLVKFANANTGAATFDLGTSEGAVALEKDDGAGALTALEAGDIKVNRYYWVHYSAASSKFVIHVPSSSGTTVEGAKTTDYTLSGGSEVVPIDISSGSIDMDELALGSMGGIVDLVIVADAGDTSANNAELRSSADALVRVIGYQAGDRLRVAYDGTTRRVVYGDGPTCPRARAVVAKTADQTLPSRTDTLILAANVGEVQDHGNHFASGQYTVPFTGRCRITPYVISDNDGVGLNYQINGTDQKDSSGKGEMPVNAVMEFDVSSGDTIKVLGFANNGGSLDVFGDAAKDETQIIFEMIERHG